MRLADAGCGPEEDGQPPAAAGQWAQGLATRSGARARTLVLRRRRLPGGRQRAWLIEPLCDLAFVGHGIHQMETPRLRCQGVAGNRIR
jgi:hypothetical protein